MVFHPVGTFRKWLSLNFILLVSYLGFFHACLIVPFPSSLAVGMVFATYTTVLCIRFRQLFINPYERLFYLAIPVDILLESLIPLHTGYSFYYCAVGFWALFVGYRFYLSSQCERNKAKSTSSFSNALADS